MPAQENMTIDERYKYLRIQRPRYLEAGHKRRGEMLSEMESVTGLHRKTLIRLMQKAPVRKPRRKQRGRTYGPEVDDAIRVIAESCDYICAERLGPNLLWLAEHLAAHGELTLTDAVRQKLTTISTSTLRRILKRIGQDQPKLLPKRLGTPRQAYRDIPMRRIPWDEPEPGHFEVDLVHHCGTSSSGQYMHSVQMVDVATGWSERVAVLGRSYLVMQDGFERILARVPFPVVEVHPDNGSEFFNHHLLRFWQDRVKGVRLTRSRPYQKNDNRFVEQKNHTLVRGYLGYERLDSAAQVRAVNELYDKLWVYNNFFQPVMHLERKEYGPGEGQERRVRRWHDPAQTPFDRLCATGRLSAEQRQALEKIRESTNPRRLRREIHELIERIFSLPCADPEQPDDVRETLSATQSSQKGEGTPVTFSIDRTIPLR